MYAYFSYKIWLWIQSTQQKYINYTTRTQLYCFICYLDWCSPIGWSLTPSSGSCRSITNWTFQHFSLTLVLTFALNKIINQESYTLIWVRVYSQISSVAINNYSVGSCMHNSQGTIHIPSNNCLVLHQTLSSYPTQVSVFFRNLSFLQISICIFTNSS